MPRGPTKAITTEIGEELMNLYAQGYTADELIKWLKNHHGITMSVRGMNAYRQRQYEARSIASMRAVGPKIELVMGDEIDKLLRFRTFCEDQFMEIWRNLPERERNSSKTMFKFMEGMQKAQAQIFMVGGLNIVAKAGTTMDVLTQQWNDKLDRLVNPTKDDTIKDAELTPDEES